jgi:gliding motility-associated-like protein
MLGSTTFLIIVKLMKTFLLALLACCISLFSSAQHSDSSGLRTLINNAISLAGKYSVQHYSLHGVNRNNFYDSAIRNPFQRKYTQSLIRQKSAPHIQRKNPDKQNPGNINTSKRMLGEICKDTSYIRLLGIQRSAVYIESTAALKEGGLLIAATMYDTARLPNPTWRSYGLVLKLDDDGNITWLKQFEDLTPGDISHFYMERVFELPNKDIVCTGLWNNNSSDSYTTMVYRLSSTGNIIWKNAMKSSMELFQAPSGIFNFLVSSAAEGKNGDLILCGTNNMNLSSGKVETVVLLDKTGNIIWDVNFGNYGYDGSYLLGAEGIDAFLNNDQIILVGLSHGTTNPRTAPAINFYTLNYADGSLLNKRFFRPDYVDDMEEFYKSFSYWENKCTHLSNGHLLFYGKLFSDFGNMDTPAHYFGVVEFDASFNPVDAYTIYSNLASNYYNNYLHFDAGSKGLISVLEYVDMYDANIFFGSFYNKQFLKQRKKSYRGIALPGYYGFTHSKSGYAFAQSYFKNALMSKSFIEYIKMHDSDTSSECLGKDTLLFRFAPLNIIEDPDYFYMDANQPDKMKSYPLIISQTDTLTTFTVDGCNQTNYCNIIKMRGDTIVCGDTRHITFTASRNKECGAIVQWRTDINVVDSMHILSDTSATIWFKNINWKGKIYAVLPQGACLSPVMDSLNLYLTQSQLKMDLGKDTAICPENTIVLHAGAGYKSYKWQDNSTDSVFSASTPGQYYVATIDFCGNIYRDTINITAAPPIPFDIGPDLKTCANVPLKVQAPAGFLQYSWSPAYQINTTTASSVIISPLQDTVYYIMAEKSPGCFAYDTLRVKVYTSPSINLGNDTSFCEGADLILYAGSGFSQVYWSTGSTAVQISVTTPGLYSVTGITADNCESRDTINIAHVWKNPVVDLGTDSILCEGSVRTLNPGNFTSYLWQDGSNAPTYTVTSPGVYSVSITDNNACTAKDTLSINTIAANPSNFLKATDSVCSYGELSIKPLNTFKNYLWSTGATTSSIYITSPTVYTLKVTDFNGCTGTDTTTVYLKDCLKGFYIPSAFTPNNDKLNDVFKPMIGGILISYEFTIYNRWGQMVFTTKNIHTGWDGTVGSNQQNTGAFIWTCIWETEGNEKKLEKGTVMLLR